MDSTGIWKLATALALGGTLASAEPYRWGNVAFEGGGFVSGIVTSRTQPGLLYARTDVGGAYRWDTLGGRWVPLLDWIPEGSRSLFGVEALALDAQDSRRVYMLCGIPYFNYGKTAILRSFDYGATFDTVIVSSQFKAHGNGNGRQTGEKLAVDPANGGILFCGTRLAGLWKSSDTGKTWSQASRRGAGDTSSANLVNNNGISFVLFDPSSAQGGSTKTLYMGVSTAKSDSNLCVSTDGGSTFTGIPGGPSLLPMRAVLSRGSLYITYSNAAGPSGPNQGAIYKYTIAGGTWTNITPKDTATGSYFGSGGTSYSSGFGGISVDPTDPDHLVASTLCYWGNQWRWANGKDNYGDLVFVSKDGGTSWRRTSAYATPSSTNFNADPAGNAWISNGGGNGAGANVHWVGSVEFDPAHPSRVWATSGNGVFRADEIDAPVAVWKFQCKGLEETVPLDIVSIPGGPLVTAIGDYDGATYTDISQSAPRHLPAVGSTQSMGYAPLNGNLLRTGVVTVYGTYSSIDYNEMFYSRDGGATWKQTDSSKVKGPKGVVALSADGKVFLHRPENGATTYRSVDSGDTWTAISTLGSNGGNIVPDPVNPARFYTMTSGDQGAIFASSDAGMTFAKVGSLVDNGKGLYASSTQILRTVPGKEGELWASLDQFQDWTPGGYGHNGLAHSEDGGATWTRLPSVAICGAVGLGKAAPGASYFALYIWGAPATTDPVGIYRSIDKGATWIRVNDGMHQFGGPGNGQFVVGDFNVYGRVYMSTVGRGIVVGEPAGASGVERTVRSVSGLRRLGRIVLSDRMDEIRLTDLRGRQIRKSEIVGGRSRLDLAGLARGIYVARSGTEVLAVDVAR